MYFAGLDRYLRTETPTEKWHKENPGVISNFYADLPFVMKEGEKTESIALHYFSERKLNHKTILDEYFRILFHHLVNATNEQMSDRLKKENDDVIYYVLNYISTHFQNGRLEEIAGKLGYNYNYLSNLIREKTGKTFSRLKLEHQLNMAYKLIAETDLPVSEVCLKCGITNQTYFYRKFSEFFGMLPTGLRSQ